MFLRNQGEIVTSFAVCSTDSLRKHPPNQEGNALLSLSLLPFSLLSLSLSLFLFCNLMQFLAQLHLEKTSRTRAHKKLSIITKQFVLFSCFL